MEALLHDGDSTWVLGTSEGAAHAAAAWREAYRRSVRIGSLRGEASSALRLGELAQALQQPDSGVAYLRRAALLFVELRDSVQQGSAESSLAMVYLDMGVTDSARVVAGRAIRTLEPLGPSAELTSAYLTRSGAEWSLRAFEASRVSAASALASAKATADTSGTGSALYRIGLAWQGLNRPDSAAAHFAEAARVVPAPDAWRGSDHPHTRAAIMYAAAGKRELAREQLARLAAILRAAHDTSDLPGAMPYIRAAVQQDMLRTPEGYATARGYWETAILLYDLSGDRRAYAATLQLMANGLAGDNKLDSAVAVLRKALPIQLEMHDSALAGATMSLLGAVLTDLHRGDAALAPLTRARDTFRSLHDNALLALALERLARAYYSLNRTADAGPQLAEAALARLSVPDSGMAQTDWGGAGNMFYYAHRRPEAVSAYRQEAALARALGDTAAAGKAFANVGFVESELFAFDSALVAFRTGLPFVRAARDSRLELLILRSMGEAYYRVTQLDSSVTVLRSAIALATTLRDSSSLAVAHNDLGTTFDEMGRPDSALAHLRQSLPISLTGQNFRLAGTTSTNIGNILSHQPATRDSALWYYRQGLTWQLQAKDTANAGVTLGNIASWFGPMQPDSALRYYRRALTFRRAAGDRPGEAIVLSKLGQMLSFTGQADSARRTLEAALTGLRAVRARGYEVIALADLAHLYHRDPKLRNLARAVAYYDSAMTLSTAIAASAGGDADRVVYRENATDVVEDWALAWIARAKEGIDPGVAARAALGVAERGRAQALLQLMHGGSPATQSAATLSDEAWDVTRVTARPGTALAVYLVTRDTLLLWVTAPGAERGVLLSLPIPRDALTDLVAQYRAAIGVSGGTVAARLSARSAPLEDLERSGTAGASGASGGAASPAAAGKALADAILGPRLLHYLEGVRELVIVPHGALAMVPFGALTIPGDSLPLGQRVAVRYAPSLAVLFAAEQRAGAPGDRPPPGGWPGTIVVGNPRMPTVRTRDQAVPLSQLPGAAVEGRWVASRLKVAALTDTAASESSIRARLARAPLIHLATHGYAYATEAQSRESFVALAPGAGQDGLLTVGELLDDPALTLTAELVVLSACQTGLGDLKQAEGTVGLQRAFLARGARSVLVSLWNVSDEATSLLMQRFYTHWLEDSDKPSRAESLRRAQGDVRARPEFRDPRFWAAFQLVGAS